jgi:glyoxylase-like metal-dependent hydrolase (beta-lactamase superfamily II)
MRKAAQIVLAVVGALVVAVALLYLGFIAPRYHGVHCTWDLDLAKVRQLAASLPGDKPQQIRVEDIGGLEMPLIIARPGSPWKLASFHIYAYQLVFADRTILVDTAMSPAQGKDAHMSSFDEAAWQRVAAGLDAADEVYFTHEHADHMGGAFSDDRWAKKLRLTPQQLDSKSGSQPKISAAARATAKTIHYEKYLAIAPGVVLIEAAGHTTGSQMVFVSRADGTELILTGDTAWIVDNIEQEQPPAKLAFWLTKGNPNDNACQLSALKRVQGELAIMPGHDPERMKALIERGVLVKHFK